MAENEIYFDPTLDVPEGLINVKVGYVDEDEDTLPPVAPSQDDWDAIYQSEEYNEEDDSNEELEGEDFLDVPNEIVIISQAVRTAPDGSQVVDVVIDVEEVSGLVDYQVRVTKV